MSTFGFLPSVGPWELILILVVALIVFGPGKLPEIGRSLGKGINEFKRASLDIQKQFQEEVNTEPPKPKETPTAEVKTSETNNP